MIKTTLREIKQSFGRYMAILAIIALGVGFFAGLKITKPVMIDMADNYWKDKQLYDFRLLSTMGFEQENVDAFARQEDVRAVEGAVSADILYMDGSENENVMKVHSLPEKLNQITLVGGRMPEKGNECVVDSNLYIADQIGEKIRLSANNEEEDGELFAYKEYTVVGLAKSSYYANFERGNTSLGSGRISGFMYIPMDGFDCDYYTEVFIKFDQDCIIYSDQYQSYIDGHEAKWKEICKEQALCRYQRIVDDAENELSDARAELNSQEAEAKKELADAQKELEDGEKELKEGREVLEKAKKELADAKKELDNQSKLLDEKEEELKSQMALLNGTDGAYPGMSGEGVPADGIPADYLAAGMDGAMAGYPMGAHSGYGQNGEMKEAQMAAAAQLEAAQAEISAARSRIAAAKEQIAEGEAEIKEKEAELADGEREAAKGRQEYEDAKGEFEEEIKDAEKKLADAQAELDDLEEPDSYVLGRDTNVGYVCFENDSAIIDDIVNVISLFFFLVAALVCMTTMNRMVEEQRTQIGVLKALGYGEGVIMSKYLFYSGSAATMGALAGFFGCTRLFPWVIWEAYKIMYNMSSVRFLFDPWLAVVSLLVALLCSMGATWFTCKNELMEAAASLMRPKAPEAGKRVLFERIPFIWKRLKFLHKVSLRNIFRYKKRFFMMVAGISGCTALLVTGFGIRDSVSGVAGQQFEEIQIFDMSVVLKDVKGRDGTFADLAKEQAESFAFFCEESADLVYMGEVKTINLVVPEEGSVEDFLKFHKVSGEELSLLKSGGALISHKISENYGISEGDVIVLRDEEMREIEVTVSGVFVNYVYNYVYINADTYAGFSGKAPVCKTAYMNLKEGKDVHQASAAFMKLGDVSSVTVNEDTKERFTSMMASLDYVVILIILCAAFLAFIVLYNLTNINITERIREIATLKVLGFFKKETASYVFRENLILTGIGIGAGMLLGHYFHRFVMSQVNIDMIAFDVHVRPISYLYSILLTVLFACVVNMVMSVKLDKINMAESLKSVD